MALGREGSNVLYELVAQRHPDVVEAEFVDNVTRHLRRGEFLLLIIGDGIREGVEKIVDFVQQHSGLNFNLALVEAALYRDGADRLIVQPRVLARTEIVQRFVVEGAGMETVSEERDIQAGPREDSDWDRETQRFWTAVFDAFAFADPDAEPPDPEKQRFPMRVKVRGSGLSGEALRFVCSRSGATISCYLSARQGWVRENRIFEEMRASLDDLKQEMQPPASNRDSSWEDLDVWPSPRGRSCLGFRRECDPSVFAGSGESAEYREAVAWMRDRLNRLVSVLHPRLQKMLADD